jgi:hypothetical protein
MKVPKPRKNIKHVELWYHEPLNTVRLVYPDGTTEMYYSFFEGQPRWEGFLTGLFDWQHHVRNSKTWYDGSSLYTYLGELK